MKETTESSYFACLLEVLPATVPLRSVDAVAQLFHTRVYCYHKHGHALQNDSVVSRSCHQVGTWDEYANGHQAGSTQTIISP